MAKSSILEDIAGKEIFLLGNDAIVRGALEAGISIASTYPGTPSSEIGNTLHRIAKEAGVFFEFSVNEKVALEISGAAAIAGTRALCFMKHVGLNVASDPFMTLAYTGVRGGLVIVSADDPSMHSSQNEQDNRYYAKLANIPMLEPSTPQEAKEMVKEGFVISERFELPVIVRTTTRINHARGPVMFDRLKPNPGKVTFVKEPERFVIIPRVARINHKRLLDTMSRVVEFCENTGHNQLIAKGQDTKLGIVTSGISSTYVMEALQILGLNAKVLKLGMTHPVPEKLICDFISSVEKVVVVEELEPYLEDEIKILANENNIVIPILGKRTGHFSRLYEYTPEIVMEGLAKASGLKFQAPTVASHDMQLPNRPPTLCAACPHRATFYAAKKAAKKDTVFPMDIGCYTLGFQPPLETADILLCMGSSVGTAGGIFRTTDQQVISFIGDSTFFHSGVPGLINAVHNKHNFVLCIVDNSTTAMTGHQSHPGLPIDGIGDEAPAVSMTEIIKGMGITFLEVVDPYDVETTVNTFKRALEHESVAVIISRHPCAILEARARRMSGIRKNVYKVDQETCTKCKICISKFACPAFYQDEETIHINKNLCEGCGVCAQICPQNAIGFKEVE